MSKVFGFDISDPAGLQSAIRAAQPLAQEIENRAGGILESVLDRIDGAYIAIEDNKIVLHLTPIPKAVK